MTCREGDLRLLDLFEPGVNLIDGWLQICLNNEWGTICDRQWDYLDSIVACKQLGHNGGFHGKPRTNINDKCHTKCLEFGLGTYDRK